MFIEIETDMCLKETAEAKNIREWIKGAYISLRKNVRTTCLNFKHYDR